MKTKRVHTAKNGHLRNGDRRVADGELIGNKILLAIPDAEYRRISGHLEFLQLPSSFSLHEPHKKQRYVYFLNRGLASIVVAMHQGRDVEAGVVGCEGAVGGAVTVGLDRSPLCVVAQIRGDAFRIAAHTLQDRLHVMPDLRLRLNRYEVLQGMQVAQTAACNRLHAVSHRLARWLLMSGDRVGVALPITHDFLATMLGTDRPSVTLAAGALKKDEAIKYGRGTVHIINRKKLETAACECYRVVQQLNGHLGLN